MDDEKQLWIDARDAFMAGLAITEEAIELMKPTRNQADNAQRHASAANAKLMELQCRQRMGKVGV